MEHSEEILNVKCLEYSSSSWARSMSLLIKRSSGQYVSTLIPFSASDSWKIFQEQQKDGKAILKISRGIRRIKMQCESMEKQMNSSDKFLRIFVIIYSSREDKEH